MSKIKNASRASSKARASKGRKAAPAPREMTLEGYKGMHRKGSRKSRVHEAFDKKGFDPALKFALSLKIKDGSARRWLSSWGGRKAAMKGKRAA